MAMNAEYTPLFRARGITKIYHPGTETEVRALDGVDLDLYEGELAVLLGASGSGKSTLLNILGGLDVPTDGTLSYRDEELTGAGEVIRAGTPSNAVFCTPNVQAGPLKRTMRSRSSRRRGERALCGMASQTSAGAWVPMP